MKIVFLDIDGVLVNRRSFWVRRGNFPTGDPPCVAALNVITDATGAVIVITSTWRTESSLPELKEFLIAWGATASVLDVTPVIEGGSRADEIRAWVRTRADIESFVVIDDQQIGGLSAHFVRTDEVDGLRAIDADKAIEVLRRS